MTCCKNVSVLGVPVATDLFRITVNETTAKHTQSMTTQLIGHCSSLTHAHFIECVKLRN